MSFRVKFVSGAKRIFPRINGFRRLQSSRDTGWLSSAPKNSEQAGPGMRERDKVSPRAPLYPPPAPRGTRRSPKDSLRLLSGRAGTSSGPMNSLSWLASYQLRDRPPGLLGPLVLQRTSETSSREPADPRGLCSKARSSNRLGSVRSCREATQGRWTPPAGHPIPLFLVLGVCFVLLWGFVFETGFHVVGWPYHVDLSLPPECWSDRRVSPLLVYKELGVESRVSYMLGKCSTH